MESINVTPRIKVGIILIGFLVIKQSLTLLEFTFTGIISLPLEIELILIFFDFSITGIAEGLNTNLNVILDPYSIVIPSIGLITLIFGSVLFTFGFPRKKELEIRTSGNNYFRINASIPDEFLELLSGASRKNPISHSNNNWFWDLPLLEEECICYQTQMGVINKKNQLLGLLGIFLFLNSFENSR